jgi:GNAT superfamily N-acetyltransferase
MPHPSSRVLFNVSKATVDDAGAIADVLRHVLARRPDCGWAFPATDEQSLSVLTQTGFNLLVARDGEGTVGGVVRTWDEEGIGWFDMLAAARAGAGYALLRAVERRAQDAGLRLVRLKVPETSPVVAAFQRWGYRPVSHTTSDGSPLVVLEKRLPLLTVREQRREDAGVIAQLTGADPWPFEQGQRSGWFVAADGERVVGVVGVRDSGAGVASIQPPSLRDGYRGRGLELWMIARAVLHAETKGFHTATLAAEGWLRPFERDLEDAQWHREDQPAEPRYVRRFSGSSVVFDEDRQSHL